MTPRQTAETTAHPRAWGVVTRTDVWGVEGWNARLPMKEGVR